jgi:hypothetical protein
MGRVAAEGGRVGVACHQRSVNRLQDAIQILINVIIPKAKDAKAGARKFAVAFRVLARVNLKIMLTTIDLNNKPVFQTNEVNNVAFTRRLSTEMKPALSP